MIFDDFFIKLIQLLSKKEDKRKFRFNPTTEQIGEYEKIIFRPEAYNDIYEKVYGNEVTLSLKNDSGKEYKYTFINNEQNANFEISGLPQGIYKYVAQTTLNQKLEIIKGEFSVVPFDLENSETAADFNMLKQLSLANNGIFVKGSQLQQLKEKLKENKSKSIIYSSENLIEVINIKWIFVLILLLITFEWGTRKYLGSY